MDVTETTVQLVCEDGWTRAFPAWIVGDLMIHPVHSDERYAFRVRHVPSQGDCGYVLPAITFPSADAELAFLRSWCGQLQAPPMAWHWGTLRGIKPGTIDWVKNSEPILSARKAIEAYFNKLCDDAGLP